MLEKLAQLIKKAPPEKWQVEDFCGIDQLHLGGIGATHKLLDWLDNSLDNTLDSSYGLDIGCGLGGTSRLVWANHCCSMVGLDINTSYIDAAKMLSASIHPAPKCQFVVGNILHLPFEKPTFDFVISQHACMNIKQKGDLLKGLYAVLKPGGQVLMHEVMLQPNATEADIIYPTPWANKKDESHLCTWASFNSLAVKAGFEVNHFEDDTNAALHWIRQARTPKPTSGSGAATPTTSKPLFTPSLALGAMAADMSANMLYNIEAGTLQVVSISLREAL